MLVLAREVASGAYGVARAAATIWVGARCGTAAGALPGWDEFDS